MECSYKNCRKPVDLATRSWNVGKLCRDHFMEACTRYGPAKSNPKWQPHEDSLVNDFAKVHVLLWWNTTKCLEYLGKLEQELSAAKGYVASRQANRQKSLAEKLPAARYEANPSDPRFEKNEDSYVKLSRALEYYEGYCWFPANRAMLSGLLGPDAFFTSLKLGFNKDPGAGPLHGDQSHRVQWHAIMRAMTNDFEKPIYRAGGWNHSPLQLFYEFTQGKGQSGGAWSKAMDSKGNDGWGNPDQVLLDLLNSRFVLIKDALTRRVMKHGGPDIKPDTLDAKSVQAKESERGRALLKAFTELRVRNQIQIPPGRPLKPGEIRPSFDTQVVSEIYRWQKTQTKPPAGDPHVDAVHRAAMKVLEYAKTKPELVDFVKPKPSYAAPAHNLLVKKDAPEKLLEIDEDMVKKSLDRFCPMYQYSKSLGANPIPAGPW